MGEAGSAFIEYRSDGPCTSGEFSPGNRLGILYGCGHTDLK